MLSQRFNNVCGGLRIGEHFNKGQATTSVLWACEFISLWGCEFISLWVCEFMSLWVYEFVSLWVYEFVSL